MADKGGRRSRRRKLPLLTRLSLAAPLLLCALFAGCRSHAPAPASTPSIDPTNQLPFGNIDAPTPGMHLPRTFAATGWALDDGGIAGIRVFVDDKYLMSIDRRTVREDLNSVFPAFTQTSRRHGWAAVVTLPATTPAGVHTFMVQLVDSAGLTRDLAPVTFIIDPAVPPIATTASSPAPTLAGELPFGAVDEPKADAHVPRSFSVSGWALDDQGVREIRVFIDRVFHTMFAVKGDRQDVLRQYADYAAGNPTPGWSGTLTLSPGPHSVIFQAVDTNGLTHVLDIVSIVVAM